MDGDSAGCIVVVLLLFVLNAIMYGFGEAVQKLTDQDLEEREENGAVRFVSYLMERPLRFITTLHVSSLLLTVLSAVLAYRTILEQTAEMESISRGAVLAAGLLGLVLVNVIFGILVPKKLAGKNPEKRVFAWANTIHFLCILFLPLTGICYVISGLILRLFQVDIRNQEENVTEEEIMSMVNEGHEQGVLEASEAEMITNIFEFGDKEAADIMVHRTSMIALNAKTTLKEAATFILEENYSRFPVYVKNIDQVIGILYLRDALDLVMKEECEDVPLQNIPGLLRRAHFIPETRNISQLFREMQSQKIHIAIVVDEYGQTSGLLTMEDILEEIVGNIMDEYDEEEDMVQQQGGIYTIDGIASFEETAELLGFEPEEGDDFETMNGFLTAKIGKIVQEDERPEIIYKNYRFKVLSVENRRIETMQVEKISCQNE